MIRHSRPYGRCENGRPRGSLAVDCPRQWLRPFPFGPLEDLLETPGGRRGRYLSGVLPPQAAEASRSILRIGQRGRAPRSSSHPPEVPQVGRPAGWSNRLRWMLPISFIGWIVPEDCFANIAAEMQFRPATPRRLIIRWGRISISLSALLIATGAFPMDVFGRPRRPRCLLRLPRGSGRRTARDDVKNAWAARSATRKVVADWCP